MMPTLHIMRKDARRLRWVLALWLAVLAARVTLSLNGAAAAGESLGTGLFLRELAGTMGMVELLVTALIVARLVHEEPLVGFTAFWLTRPYNVGTLILAKLLFAGVALVVLPLFADLVTMAMLDAGPLALVRGGSSFAVGYAAWVLSLMVIATLTPSLGAFVMTILGIVAGVSMLLAALVGVAALWSAEPSGYTPPEVPDATGGVVMLVVYLCAALSVVVYQYRHRRWRMAGGLAVAGLAATIVVPMFWPWSFARGEKIQPGPWAANAVAVHDRSWGTEVSDVDRFGRGVPRRYVNARVTLSGLPPEVSVQSIGVRSSLRFDDGVVVESGQMGGFGQSFTPSVVQAALGGVELLNPDDVFNQRQEGSPMITLTEEQFVRYRGRTGRLDANVDFHLLRTREIGTLAMMPGAAIDGGVSRIEVVSTRRRADSQEVTLRQWHARSPLSIDPRTHQRQYALRHRSRAEALMGGEESAWPMGGRGNAAMSLLRLPLAMMGANFSYGSSGGGGFSSETRLLRFPGRGFGKAPRLDPSWFDEVELVVIETVAEGPVMRAVVIQEFEIPVR